MGENCAGQKVQLFPQAWLNFIKATQGRGAAACSWIGNSSLCVAFGFLLWNKTIKKQILPHPDTHIILDGQKVPERILWDRLIPFFSSKTSITFRASTAGFLNLGNFEIYRLQLSELCGISDFLRTTNLVLNLTS